MTTRCPTCRSGAILPREIPCQDCGATEYCQRCATGHGQPVVSVTRCGPCHRKQRANGAAGIGDRIRAMGWQPVGRVDPTAEPPGDEFDIWRAFVETLEDLA